MVKAKQRGCDGNTLDSQVDTNEVTHGLAVVDGTFKRLIVQCIPLLQEIDPQHPFQSDRWTTTLTRRRWKVGRRQRLDQALPWHKGIHLCQEPFPAGDLLLAQPEQTKSALTETMSDSETLLYPAGGT